MTERSLIAALRPALPSRDDVLVAAGDDCALTLPPSGQEDLVLKSDPVLEGRHFLPGTDLKRVGHKALARVLSDFAAMGAEPRWALIDFAGPENTTEEMARLLYAGINELAAEHQVAIVGGDTVRSVSGTVELHVFAAGAVPKGSAMLRSNAQPGDSLYVTGMLGGSFPSQKHLDFEPRLAVGKWLRERGIRCCIDISDGLASELWHIAEESNVRLFLISQAVPLSPAAEKDPKPLERALYDGEDFELLFTVPPTDISFMTDFLTAFPDIGCAPVGVVGEHLKGGRVTFGDGEEAARELPKGGFDHFAPTEEK